MPALLYERDGRIGRITLNRPEVLNAIDNTIPQLLKDAVAEADADPRLHLMVLSGAGRAFCAGYDLSYYTQGGGSKDAMQDMPWDPIQDYQFMWSNTQAFMSLFHAMKPVICKVHGHAVAGGSDIALCSDLVFMADTAEIGYMPARVWGCPTTAMWVYRLGPERAKRMLFTGDKITGVEAERLGLVLKSLPAADLDQAVEDMANRMASVPINQLAMQKMLVNQAIEAAGLINTQRFATLFDGVTRHSPEGVNFKHRAEELGWQTAVRERDAGTFDWTLNRAINTTDQD